MSRESDICLEDLGSSHKFSSSSSSSELNSPEDSNFSGFFQRARNSELLQEMSSWNLRKTLRKLSLLALMISSAVVFVLWTIKSIKHRKEMANFTDHVDFKNPKDRKLARKDLSSKRDFPFEVGCRVPDVNAPRANASFVMLSRNSELDDVVSSMQSMERHFNQWFNYPWVFLNDVEFDDKFKETVTKHTKAEVEFGVVPKEHWDFPADVDRVELAEYIESQGDRQIMYGNMESYHKMCRFYSGHFYDHPLVRKREWYWRVEPNVQFFCDMTYDPFVEMEKHNKSYGFTVAIEELYYTAPSLFLETKAFIKKNKIQVQSAWDFVSKKFERVTGKNANMYTSWTSFTDLMHQVEQNVNLRKLMDIKNKSNKDLEQIKEFKKVRDIFEMASEKPPLYEDRVDDEQYNLCHFWSNFEIARTDLFLSQTYQDYFKHLEASGGFYKERWGDAPVHSLAVAMMLPREQLHYFRDVGYKHSTLGHCPNNAPHKQLPYPADGIKAPASPWYKSVFENTSPDEPVKNGVGCRCVCPRKFRELEDINSVCIRRYAQVLSDDFKPYQPIDIDKLEEDVTKVIDSKLAKGGKLGD